MVENKFSAPYSNPFQLTLLWFVDRQSQELLRIPQSPTVDAPGYYSHFPFHNSDHIGDMILVGHVERETERKRERGLGWFQQLICICH